MEKNNAQQLAGFLTLKQKIIGTEYKTIHFYVSCVNNLCLIL